MVMRLVRDDDYGPMELEEELQPPRPGTDAVDVDVSEPQDGIVSDAAEDVDSPEDSSADADAPAADLDLGALEALLLTTHHPLTAGRIGEVLDLESTKPVRKAIKQLNEAYAAA